jgi:hypothetical protein
MEEIRRLVARAKINEALEEAFNMTAGTDLQNDITLLMGRNNRLNRSINMGTVENSHVTVERNKIIYSLFEYLQDFQRDTKSNFTTTVIKHEISVKPIIDINPVFLKKFVQCERIGIEKENLEIIKVANQVIGFLNSVLDEETFEEHYDDLESNVQKLEKRPTNNERAAKVLAELDKLLPDLTELLKSQNNETSIEALLKDAQEARGGDGSLVTKMDNYFKALVKKYPQKETKYQTWEFEMKEFEKSFSHSGIVTKAAAEKRLKDRWLHSF